MSRLDTLDPAMREALRARAIERVRARAIERIRERAAERAVVAPAAPITPVSQPSPGLGARVASLPGIAWRGGQQGMVQGLSDIARLVQGGVAAASNPMQALAAQAASAVRGPGQIYGAAGRILPGAMGRRAQAIGGAMTGGADAITAGAREMPAPPMNLPQRAAFEAAGQVADVAGGGAALIGQQQPQQATQPYTPEWFAANIGAAGPAMGQAAGGAVVGGILGGPAGAAAGAFAPSFLSEAGSQASAIYKGLRKQGVSEEDALTEAFLPAVESGAAAAAVETAGGPEALIARRMGKEAARMTARQMAKDVIRSTGGEAATEPIQGSIGDVGVAQATGDAELAGMAGRRLQEAVLGGVLGLVGGGAVTAAQRFAGGPEAPVRPIEPRPAAETVAPEGDGVAVAAAAVPPVDAPAEGAIPRPAPDADQPQADAVGDVAGDVGQELSSMTYGQLRAEAQRRGVPAGGTKAQLQERLSAASTSEQSDTGVVRPTDAIDTSKTDLDPTTGRPRNNEAPLESAAASTTADAGLPRRTAPPDSAIGSSPESTPDRPPDTTSARKAWMAEDRENLGLAALDGPERKSWHDALVEAEDKGLSKPEQAMRLAAEANAKPRAFSDVETAGLVHHATRLKNEHRGLMEQIGKTEDPAAVADLSAQAARVEQEFDQLSTALRSSGTEKGRALASQKLTLDQDYSLISVKQRAKAAKGKALSKGESAKLEEVTRQLEQATQKLAEAEKTIADERAQRVIRQHKAADRKSSQERTADRAALVAKAKELARKGCH